MLQIFAAKVVIFFEICNKLGGNLVFFQLSAEFVYTERQLLVVIIYKKTALCEGGWVWIVIVL